MYRDVVMFPSDHQSQFDTSALDRYLASSSATPKTINSLTYCKPGMPVRVPMSFNTAWQYNYLRVSNPAQPSRPDFPRNYYYFITDCRYVNPNTTELVLQLDVWQTFIRFVDVHKAYVERGHIGIATQESFEAYGRRMLTVPEGFDLGSDYVTTNVEAAMIAGATTMQSMGIADPFRVIITSTTMLVGDPGTTAAPIIRSAGGSTFEGVPNGCEIYSLDMENFSKLAFALSSAPWVAQGIISIMAVPAYPVKNPAEVDLLGMGSGIKAWKHTATERIPHQERTVMSNFRSKIELPNRYRGLNKFKTYPYSFVELTTYTGTPLVLKPELVGQSDISVIQMTHLSPPNPRIAFYPFRYVVPSLPAPYRNG